MNKGTTAIGIGLIVILLLAGFLVYWFLLRDDKTPSVSDPDITLLPAASYTEDKLDDVKFQLSLTYTATDIATLTDSNKVQYIIINFSDSTSSINKDFNVYLFEDESRGDDSFLGTTNGNDISITLSLNDLLGTEITGGGTFQPVDYEISVSHMFVDSPMATPSSTKLNLDEPGDSVDDGTWQELMQLVENGEPDLLANWNPTGTIATTISDPTSTEYSITGQDILNESQEYTIVSNGDSDLYFVFTVRMTENDEITFILSDIDSSVYALIGNKPLHILLTEDPTKKTVVIKDASDGADNNMYYNITTKLFEQINNQLLLTDEHKMQIKLGNGNTEGDSLAFISS